MAVRTATVTGNWSDAATWGGSTPPGSGDSAVINVPVTLDADVTVGASGAAATAAVTVASTGSLTFATGKTLRCRGDLLVSGTSNVAPLTNVRLTLVAGCTLIFDATAATAGVQYRIQMGTAANQTPLLRVRATSGSHATIKSDVTGGALPAYYSAGSFTNQGSIDAEYLDFIDFGDATQPCWKPWCGTNDRNYFRLEDCTLTRCGQLTVATSMTGGSIFSLNRVKFIDTAATSYCLNITASSALSTGTRSITYTYFDKKINAAGLKDFTFDHCVFMNIWASTAAAWASFTNNFFRDAGLGAMTVFGDVTDCYYLKDAVGNNPHGFGAGTLDADVEYSGVVIESVLGGVGDFIFSHSPASPRTTKLRNCLLIPCDPSVNAGAESPGKLFGMLVGPNATGDVEHCTYAVWDTGETGVNTGETYAGRAGQVRSLRGNLAWRRVAGPGGYKFNRLSPSQVQDPVLAANADYNWGWNLATGSAGNGYNAADAGTPLFSTGTPGVHDGSGDPGFVDSTRNLAKWAVSMGSVAVTDALRRADAFAYLSANPGLIDDLLAYVRGGFAPTNPAMAAAAHDAASPTTAALGAPGAVAYAGVEGLPPPTLYVYDTFSGRSGTDLLNHVGQSGATWTRHPAITTASTAGAGWKIGVEGRAYCSAGGLTNPAHVLASGSSPEVEYDVVASWHFLSYTGGVSHGVVFRFDPTANSGYRLVYQTASVWRRWSIHKVVNGTATVLGTPYVQELDAGTDYAVRIRLRTTGITVLIDGVSRITSADTTFAATPGRVGLYGSGDSTAGTDVGIHIDWLAVTPPDGDLPDYDLAGPATGVPGLASDPFAVALAAGTDPGSATFTPSASGLAGTFTPTSLTLTDAARSGTFTFTPAGATAAAGTISVANDAGLIPPPAVAYAAGYDPPARLGSWRGRIHYTHSTGEDPFVLGTGFDAEIGEHYDPIRSIMEARDYCVRTDLPPTDWSVELAAEVVRYRDRWVLESLADGNAPPSWVHRYTPGLAGHYRETGDPLDAVAVDFMTAVTGPFTQDLLSESRHETLNGQIDMCRPAAWMLMAWIDREWCGLGSHPLTDSTARVLLGHCDTWTGAVGPRFNVWNKPFMVGLALRALIAYWDRYKDATDPTRAALVAQVPGRVLAVCDFLWETSIIPADNANSWPRAAVVYQQPASVDLPNLTGLTVQSVQDPTRTFTGPSSLSTVDDFYKNCNAIVSGDSGGGGNVITSYVGATRRITVYTGMGNHSYAAGASFYISARVQEPNNLANAQPILNPMVSPAFAWAYWYCERVLGDHAAAVVHRYRHDELFDGQFSAWAPFDKKKDWNQVWEWGSLWSDWRDRGDAEWPVATAFALQAPATGAAGPHSTKSGPFRLALPYGVRTAAPVVVTPSSSSGRGTFSPATAILTPDRPAAMFTFTPSALDDGASPTITASAPGLTAPAGVAYAVGPVASSIRRTFRVGPRFDRSPSTRSSLVR